MFLKQVFLLIPKVLRYGDSKNVSWYIDFKSGVVDYSLTFHDESELELDYDYVYLIDDGISSAYTGIDMRFTEINYNNENLVINFVSDTYLDNYFGIEIFIEINYFVDITLNGSEVVPKTSLSPTLALGPYEGLDVGIDRRSPVFWELSEKHGAFPYAGQIDSVTVTPGAKAPKTMFNLAN